MATAVSTPSFNGHPIQRPLKGSRISSFYPVKELPPLSALDSAFQLQEYISLLIRKDVHDVDAIVSIPGKGKGRDDGEDAKGESMNKESGGEDQKDVGDGKGEVSVDEACWIYEQLRRLAQDLSHPLITMLQQECTRQTCPEMKAGEWLYLCVAHGNEGAMEQCCAIDYILHTLDSATALLNSPRAFPSRLSIPTPSHRHFSSLARRLGRIFAHAYFHHRAAFAQAEAESALYARFLALTSRFDLVPPEFLVIPPGIGVMGFDDPDRDDGYPRPLAASFDRGRADDAQAQMQQQQQHPGIIQLDSARGDFASAVGAAGAEGQGRDPSPRKVGRNRTDTMVHSEMASVVEELGRAAMTSEGEGQSQEAPAGRGSTSASESEDVNNTVEEEQLVEASEGEIAKEDESEAAEEPEPTTETPASDNEAEAAPVPVLDALSGDTTESIEDSTSSVPDVLLDSSTDADPTGMVDASSLASDEIAAQVAEEFTQAEESVSTEAESEVVNDAPTTAEPVPEPEQDQDRPGDVASEETAQLVDVEEVVEQTSQVAEEQVEEAHAFEEDVAAEPEASARTEDLDQSYEAVVQESEATEQTDSVVEPGGEAASDAVEEEESSEQILGEGEETSAHLVGEHADEITGPESLGSTESGAEAMVEAEGEVQDEEASSDAPPSESAASEEA